MKFCALLLLLLALSNPLQAKDHRSQKKSKAASTPAPLLNCELSGNDLTFLKATAASQYAQLNLAEVVSTRAQESEVRMIGNSLFEDGKTERDALVKLAAQKGFPLPASPTAPKAAKPLQKLTGPKFDKQAMELISKLENERAATFEVGSTSQDAEIRAFAEAHYPAVQESLLLIAKLTGVSQAPVNAPAVSDPIAGEKKR